MMKNFTNEEIKSLEESGYSVEQQSNIGAIATKKGGYADSYMISLNPDGTYFASYSSEYSDDNESEVFKTLNEAFEYLDQI